MAARLFAEEGSLELPRLGGREPRLLEYLHDLIRKLRLFWRKRRRSWVPVQASANVRVDPRTRERELVSELVQLAHLLEQRLELHVVDGHDRPDVTSIDQRLAGSLDRLRFMDSRPYAASADVAVA